MKRNITVSIAAALLVAGALTQAQGASAESTSQDTILESPGMAGAGGGSFEDPAWKEEYPFPRSFGSAED